MILNDSRPAGQTLTAPCRVALGLIAMGAAAVLGAGESRADPDPATVAGIWTLSVGASKRECRMVLRAEATGKGLGLAMPPGCRKALPSLGPVRDWSMPEANTVSLDNADGQGTIVFTGTEAGVLHASDPQGNALTLTKVDPTRPNADEGPIVSLNPVAAGFEKAKAAKAQSTATAAAGSAAVPPRPAPVTMAEVAGNYAVLRGDRDTGCMVTLDGVARGPKSTMKARLAPACRDQGIIVFDPLGWQLEAGALVLTARKGHTVRLDRNDANIWTKTPADVKALALKRL